MSSFDSIGLRKGDHVLLTTGLGLSDKGVPLRLPALLVPGLQMLRDLRKEGFKAQYVVYQATDFIIKANNLDEEKAINASEKTQIYLHRFINKFFPDVKENVDLKMGRHCNIKESHLKKVEAELTKLAQSKLQKFVAPGVEESLERIKFYGGKHAGGDLYLRYTAANILLNGGYAGLYPFMPLDYAMTYEARKVIIPLGGKKEEPFFALTSYMAKSTGTSYVVKPQTVSTGNFPAYYPCPDGDLMLGESGANFKPPKRTKSDFRVLREVGADIEELQSLARKPFYRFKIIEYSNPYCFGDIYRTVQELIP